MCKMRALKGFNASGKLVYIKKSFSHQCETETLCFNDVLTSYKTLGK